MCRARVLTFVVIVTALLLAYGQCGWGETGKKSTDVSGHSVTPHSGPAESTAGISDRRIIKAVIYPFQSATVGTEVRGIVEVINYKEGDRVKNGAVVAEISKPRYSAILGEFRSNYEAVTRALEKAREDLKIAEDLYKKRAINYQELAKARSEVLILEARQQEADFKVRQAELNLKACIIKAPFDGSVAVLYRDPFETADNLEKIFEIVDTSKVYARANWPEERLTEIALGKKGVFVYDGKEYPGVIAKISDLIDPASKSKRIHVLLDNPDGKLEVGMSGILKLTGEEKVSDRGK